MLAGNIARAGAILILFTSIVHSQNIPFDYFYGRIIGRQHVSANYSDYRGGLALYGISYGVGFGDRAWLELPDIVKWKPNADRNTTDWTDPALNGAIRLSSSARYGFSLHFQDDDELAANQEWRRSNSRNSAAIGQSLTYLKGAGVRLTPKNDLYQYLDGMFLGAGQWVFEGSGKLATTKSDYSLLRQNSLGEYDSSWSQLRGQNYDVSANFGIGVASVLNLGIESGLSHDLSDEVDSSGTLRVLSDDSTRIQWHYRDRESASTLFGIRPSFVWKPKRSLWFTGNWDYLRIDRDYEILYLDDDLMYPNVYIDGYNSEYWNEYISYGGTFTWANTDKAIELTRLLDNYQGYYGTEMSASTFILGGDFNYRREYSGYKSWGIDRSSSESWGLAKAMSTNLNAKYYFTPVITASVAAHLDRRLTTRPYT